MSNLHQDKRNKYFFPSVRAFTEWTEEALSRAPMVWGAVVRLVSERKEIGGGLQEAEHHSYLVQTAGPGSCSGLEMLPSGC